MAPCRFVVLPWTEQRLSAWVLNWNSPGEKSAPACSASPWGCAVVQKAGEAERDGKPLHCEMVGGDAFCSYSTWDAQWHKVIFASAVASRQTLIFSDFSSFIVHSWLSNCCVQVSWPHQVQHYVHLYFSPKNKWVHVGELSLNRCRSSSQHANALKTCKQQKHRSLQMFYFGHIHIFFSGLNTN